MLGALSMLLLQCVKEGPMGPAGPAGENGTDGTNGVDGNVTCLECHSSAVKDAIELQYYQSVHHDGVVTLEHGEWSSSCVQCHTQEGFIAYAADEELTAIAVPQTFDCSLCHNIHESFEATDYAFRLADSVAFIFDATVIADMGNSNLCANCHQSRRAEPNIETPGDTYYISSVHYGPHHGSQANILYGAGYAEIDGLLSYPSPGGTPHMGSEAGCTGCHMFEYEAGEGGYTFTPSLNACNVCYASASENFDYNGVQTETQALLDELRDLLLAEGVIEYVVEDEAYEPIVGTYDMVPVQAFFNWVGIEEDRS